MKTKGAVACGHPATAAAAQEILEDGGNAFDAALAALCAATVAEPVLCSLAGGGFLMARPHDGQPCLYDFFVQTPIERPGDRRPIEDLDFYPVLADFGTATQEFHIGLAAMATPGVPAGLCAVQADLCRLPLSRLVEPAIRLASEGVTLRPVDTYLFQVVGRILTARADSKAVYTKPDGALLSDGDLCHQPELAETLAALGAEGERLFYEGDLAQQIVSACRTHGGLLTAEDLRSYRAERREPLQRDYRGARILTNPPPSTGGILIAFSLALLDSCAADLPPFGSTDHLILLSRVMDLTNKARIEARLEEAHSEEDELASAGRLFDDGLLSRYANEVRQHRPSSRGTTHISVADAEGNIAALTLSNGEGCGYVLPGRGVMLNNMLGEEDLNAGGFHSWARHSRLSSMMAPTIAFLADGTMAALGSGGSNRIRTALLQVLMNLIDFDMELTKAVTSPRVHFENGVANFEAGFPEAATRAALDSPALRERVSQSIAWPPHNLFFGGVHAVIRRPDGELQAAGDPRRGGAALVA